MDEDKMQTAVSQTVIHSDCAESFMNSHAQSYNPGRYPFTLPCLYARQSRRGY